MRAFLGRDHARIEGLHERLMDLAEGGDRPERRELWRRFQRAVLDHMAVEDRLLERFGSVQAAEATVLREQHAELRRLLDEAGRDLAHHHPRLQAFITLFHDHALREDGVFYRWADEVLDPATQTEVARELAESDRASALGRR